MLFCNWNVKCLLCSSRLFWFWGIFGLWNEVQISCSFNRTDLAPIIKEFNDSVQPQYRLGMDNQYSETFWRVTNCTVTVWPTELQHLYMLFRSSDQLCICAASRPPKVMSVKAIYVNLVCCTGMFKLGNSLSILQIRLQTHCLCQLFWCVLRIRITVDYIMHTVSTCMYKIVF